MPYSPSVSHGTNVPPLALLVDHDADTRKMYRVCLEPFVCEVVEAEDGREALATALTRRPSVIVMETRLPGIDGFDLCRLLRRDEATRGIPIIFVTADARSQDVERAQSSGADAVFVKPCLPEELAAEIQRLLGASVELRQRSAGIRARADRRLRKSEELIGRSRANVRRTIASRAFQRLDTTQPPAAPPPLVCPACDRALQYQRSHVGGVSVRHAEQWDYFECPACGGAFQYRHRTRKLRRV